MSFLEEFLAQLVKGTKFEQNRENLNTAADKADEFATQVENGYDSLMGFLEQASEFVSDYVTNLRVTADEMRSKAAVADSPYDDVRPKEKTSTVTREQKLAHIQTSLRAAGITSGSKWLDPVYTGGLGPEADKIIDYTYRIFGGK